MDRALGRVSPRHSGDRFRFWASARAEARRTWNGRWRWLWRAAALALLAVAVWGPPSGLNGSPFDLFCAVSYLVPVWLLSNLLAPRHDDAPPSPGEWWARAWGRLAPFQAAEAIWLAPWTFRCLWGSIREHQRSFDLLSVTRAMDVPHAWYAWVAVFILSALPFAAMAALLSATRLPRPVICVLMVGCGWCLASLLALGTGDSGPFTNSGALQDRLYNWTWGGSFIVGVYSILAVVKISGGKLNDVGFGWMCWIASGAFVLYTLPPVLSCWWIAARRQRRFRRALGADTPELGRGEPAPLLVS